MPRGYPAGYDRRMSAPRRWPPSVPTILLWCGLLVYPVLVYAAAQPNLYPVASPDPYAAVGWPRMVLPILAVTLLLIAVIRRAPVLTVSTMLVALVAVATLQPMGWVPAVDELHVVREVQIVMVDLALGYLASIRPRRISAVVAVVVAVAQVGSAMAFPMGQGVTTSVSVAMVLGVATVWLIGQSVWQRRRYREAQLAQAEAQAVQAERLRIAREVHDMIAHSIGVIAIQAGMGRRVIGSRPGEARDALAAIEDTSRETLAGLRRMLVGLRRTDHGTGVAPTDPAPGLADLDGLVERSRRAGVTVDVRREGDPGPLPPDIDLSAFRIVQEAVTNVARHSGTACCEVVVGRGDGELWIEVTDDGRGGGVPGTGYGIAGMRERVGLLHGEFSAGPRAGGGFRVAARIPVPAGVR
jgi:signal transduction histidine kinase